MADSRARNRFSQVNARKVTADGVLGTKTRSFPRGVTHTSASPSFYRIRLLSSSLFFIPNLRASVAINDFGLRRKRAYLGVCILNSRQGRPTASLG